MKTAIAIIVLILVVLTFTPSPEAIVSTQDTTPASWEGECANGVIVTYVGKPLYDLDPEMEHMWGMDCMMDNQCRVWSPIPVRDDLRCCAKTGVCYE